MKNLLFTICLFAATPASAQLFVDTLDYSAETLVMDFFNGSCVDVTHVDYIGKARQKTFFEGSQSGLGVNAGILLTTGESSVAVGPNDEDGAAGGYGTDFPNNQTPFSQFLQQTTGTTTSFDWSLLHLTIVPHIDSIGFQYVFASEEYCEYVGTQFNDAFGFLISGPGINGVQNIAMIPNSAAPVSINNVNYLSNQQYYRTNTPLDSMHVQCAQPASNDPMSEWIQYDGLTQILSAHASVIPDSSYEVWIGIADIADGVWDSGIFLSIESLCGDSLLSPVANFQQAVNGNSVTFQNSTKYATAWHWDFGDGSFSDERFPTHTYADLSQPHTVRLIATNYCCADTTILTIDAVSGTQDSPQPECRVYPSRFNNTLTVELPGAWLSGTATLTDIAGRTVLNQPVIGSATFQTGQLPAGTYFLEIRTDNHWRWVKKVVKSRRLSLPWLEYFRRLRKFYPPLHGAKHLAHCLVASVTLFNMAPSNPTTP